MAKQLDMFKNQYSFNMTEVKLAMLQAEILKLQQVIEKKDLTIRAYKGHFTKQQSKTK
jgi:hypothetical protein